MNPQEATSVGTSVILYALGTGLGVLVAKGIMTQDQANALAPQIAAIIITLAGIAIIWWKKTQHSPAALGAAVISTAVIASANHETLPSSLQGPLVAAVNGDAMPGVKVVSDTSPSPQVMLDPKGNVRPSPVADHQPIQQNPYKP
jgi:hypothetical protein